MISTRNKISLYNRPTHEEQKAAAHYVANAVPWWLAHRDNFSAKAPGPVTGGSAPPIAFCSYPLHVIANANINIQTDSTKTITR